MFFFALPITVSPRALIIINFCSSVARRPIYPSRRSRYKYNTPSYHHSREHIASDEGNTSEYSNPPSSKSSTLESNPDRLRVLPHLASKRPSERSDGSSDSESEENVTIATQVCYDMNKAENLVWTGLVVQSLLLLSLEMKMRTSKRSFSVK